MRDDAYKNLTILCVEDETGVRRRIVNTLSYYFGKVLEAGDGLEGFALYEEHAPDMILCDVEMPVMDGISLIKKIRENDVTTPIVMLTAYSSETYLLQLINLRIQHYILKPVNAERLLGGIEAGLKGKYSGNIKLAETIFLDVQNNTLRQGEKVCTLSQRETKFLALLGENRGRVIDYVMIEEELWNDRPMSQGALKSFVRDLRKKMEIDLFENVSQRGYRLCL